MAAIVRSCARTLQLTQTSGPCCPASARSMSSTMRHITREAPATLSQAMEEIQVHKEELYDLLAEARLTDRDNRKLIKDLSRQIKPRPNDYRWCWTRTVQFTQELVKPIIPLTGSFLLLLAMFEEHETKTVAKEKKRQQQQAEAAAAAVAAAAAKQENRIPYYAEENLQPYARGATSV